MKQRMKGYVAIFCCLLLVLGDVLPAANKQQPVEQAYAAEEGVTGFVSRLYTVILGREADAGGLAEWTGYLQNGTFTGAEVAAGFIMSEEFLGKDMENEEFVQIMYRAFFGREADPSGLATWVDFLNQGYRKSYIFAGFANSTEFDTLCTTYGVETGFVPVTVSEQQPNLSDKEYNIWLFVERLYTEVLGRTPDMNGIKEWVDYLQAGTFSGAQVAEGFIMSEEFQNKVMSNEAYVQIMYKAFFGREADPGGLATWVNALETEYTKEYVFAGFANSVEFGTLCQMYGIMQGEVEVPEITPELPASFFEYVVEDGGIRIDALKDKTLTQIRIPATIDGYPVTTIGGPVFENCKNLTVLELPAGLVNIWAGAFRGCSSLTEITIPDSVRHINDEVFADCSSLTEIIIPDKVEYLGLKVFYNCSSLKNIKLPSKIGFLFSSMFQGCSSLSRIEIPANITHIENGTFKDISTLSSIVTEKGSYTEQWATKNGFGSLLVLLGDDDIEEEMPVHSTYRYSYYDGEVKIEEIKDKTVTTVEIPEEIGGLPVTSIGGNAFRDLNNLTEVIIPDTVEYISDGAFSGCTNLTEIEIPDSVRYMGRHILKECNSLSSIVTAEDSYAERWAMENRYGDLLGREVTEEDPEEEDFAIDEWLKEETPASALEYFVYGGEVWITGVRDESLQALWFPSKIDKYPVTTIAFGAFSDNLSLVCVRIPDSVTYIENNAFEGCVNLVAAELPSKMRILGSSVFADCWKLKKISMPSSVKSFGSSVFSGCCNLTEVVIPSGATALAGTFLNCFNLTDVTIPSGVTNLVNTFAGCTSLTEVELPSTVKSIAGAFSGCTSLFAVKLSDNITNIGDETFKNCKNLTEITLPSALREIGTFAFYNCTEITGIELPDSVEYINFGAFINCSCLTQVEIPYSLTEIGTMAFFNCSGLERVSIPEGVSCINSAAFALCNRLTALELPESVFLIEDDAFTGCGNLTDVITVKGSYAEQWVKKAGIANASGETAQMADVRSGETPAEAFEYEYIDLIDKNGNLILDEYGRKQKAIKITGLKDSTVTELCIPQEMEGYPVIEVNNFAFYNHSQLTDIRIPSGVLKIGGSAFVCAPEDGYISNVTRVDIPDSVAEIGKYAFQDCENLIDIRLPEGLTLITAEMFYGCSSLTGIVIPESVWAIGDAAFEGCTSLVEIEIPEGVQEVRLDTFQGCSSLTKVKLPDSIQIIGTNAFRNCRNLTDITIPSGVRLIDQDAFEYCTALTTVQIPNSVTEIGSTAFGYCYNLAEMEIPSGVTEFVGNDVFHHTPWFTKQTAEHDMLVLGDGILYWASPEIIRDGVVEIPDGIKQIGDEVFDNWQGEWDELTEVVIPDSVTQMGNNTFSDCSNLKNINIPENITSLESYVFKGCSSLTEIKLPDGLTEIGGGAFRECYNLTAIEIPKGVTYIGSFAFDECVSLTTMELPDKIEGLYESAFSGCISMESIKLPAELRRIGKNAFTGCRSLKEIALPEGLESIGWEAFFCCDGLTGITIPASVSSLDITALDCANLETIIVTKGSYAEEWLKINGYEDMLVYQ